MSICNDIWSDKGVATMTAIVNGVAGLVVAIAGANMQEDNTADAMAAAGFIVLIVGTPIFAMIAAKIKSDMSSSLRVSIPSGLLVLPSISMMASGTTAAVAYSGVALFFLGVIGMCGGCCCWKPDSLGAENRQRLLSSRPAAPPVTQHAIQIRPDNDGTPGNKHPASYQALGAS